MSDELAKSRPSVALPLFPLSFLCLSLTILCLSLTFLCLSLTFLCLFPFLFCLEKKRLVVRRAATTHCCRERGMEDPVAALSVRLPLPSHC
jgi:hypothetical protein